MATIKTTPSARRQSTLPTPTLFTGSFDDASFSHTSPQLTKPINIPHNNASFSATDSQRPTTFFSYSSSAFDDSDSTAVLDDSDVHSEDELPPSPMRRHSGAMSISQEHLSSCFDREALRRETAAHQQRHHHHHHHQEEQQKKEAFSLHEDWDCEVDGPHMALWTPGSSSSLTSSPVGNTTTTSATTHHKRRRLQQQAHQVSFIEGPMMCLWEP